MSDPFFILPPRGPALPIVVSCPHSGTEIPADVAAMLEPAMARDVPDTDWFVNELYEFAADMGITVLSARYSRFLIDLNRDPDDKPLYTDGRHMTGLVPTTAFDTRPLYEAGKEPDAREIKRRVDAYYRPYHAKAQELVDGLKTRHKHVLFYEAHSIKRLVPSIRKTPFPDLMLGDQKGKTAAKALSDAALRALKRGGYDVAHNEPFMGGYLTRKFGRPDSGVHALQLEMAQDVYMDEAAAKRDAAKQARVRKTLQPTLAALAKVLAELP